MQNRVGSAKRTEAKGSRRKVTSKVDEHAADEKGASKVCLGWWGVVSSKRRGVSF